MNEVPGMSEGWAVRPGTEHDLAAAFACAWACDHPESAPPSDPYRYRYITHELETGRFVVAEATSGEVVGFAGSTSRGGVTHLGDLFIRPDRQSGGVGAALLDAALEGAGARTTMASKDPRALALYARAGLRPFWPYLYLRGDPRRVARQSGIVATEGSVDAIVSVDQTVVGRERALDHRYWSSGRGARRLLLQSEPRAVAGFAYLQVDGDWAAVITMAVAEAGLGGPALAAVASVACDWGATTLDLTIPGPHDSVPELFRAGFRLDDFDTFMASEDGLVDARRHVPDNTFG